MYPIHALTASGTAQQRLVLAHNALLKTRGLQFDFRSAPPPAPTPPWFMALLRALTPFAPLMVWVFWGGLILGAILIAVFIAREMLGYNRPKVVSQPTVDWRPEPAQARALLADADRLAAAGAFDEAVHLLLIRSIGDIAERRPGAIRPALTSRDIAALDGLPGAARGAFTLMAQMVERSLFGGQAASADDFGRCRQEYETFAFPQNWA